MSEAVAAQAQATAAPAAIEVPPADQPPAATKPLTFAERWKAKTGEDVEAASDDDTPTEPDAEPAAADAPAEPAKPGNGVTADDKAMFEALAKKLGYSIDGKGVLPSDRIAWEQAKKRQENGIAQREEKLRQAEAEWQKRQQLTPEERKDLEWARALRDSYKRADPDEFAKHLGVKDFNDFQATWLGRLSDPNYEEIKALRARAEEQDKAAAEARQRAEQEAQAAERQRAYSAYMSSLSETCKASSNPVAAALHDDPNFLQAVYRIQNEHWDPVQQKTVTVEEAIKLAAKGARQDLESELRGMYERLGKAFGAPPAPEPAATPAKNGKRPAPKTGVTPVATTQASGGPKRVSEMSQAEWRAHALKRLEEAED